MKFTYKIDMFFTLATYNQSWLFKMSKLLRLANVKLGLQTLYNLAGWVPTVGGWQEAIKFPDTPISASVHKLTTTARDELAFFTEAG